MRKNLVIILLIATSLVARSQTNNSPYSVLGIGDIEDSYFNRATGLANTGIAYRNNRNLINNNPASLSALENQFFIGEIGLRAKYVTYTGSSVDPYNNTSFDITFRRFAFGTKIGKHWGTTVGLMPFSSENYEFNVQQPIQGSIGETANAYYQGYGGVNKVYWANAYEFFHHISLGLTTSYLFGSINQKSIIQNPIVPSAYASTNKNIFLSNFYLDYGLQLFGKIGKTWDYTLGATFANKTDLNAQYTVLILGQDSSILKNATIQQTYFTLPNTYGAGISLTKNKKYTFLADYKFQQWSPLNYSGFNYSLEDSYRASIGFEISQKKNVYNSIIENNYFQFGLYYGETYLNVYGTQIKDMGVTAAVGINAKRSPMQWALTFNYGITGTQQSKLVQLNYLNIGILISYRDFWYTKGKRFN
jgi:hypothetical protein